jgi:hypothetical protein
MVRITGPFDAHPSVVLVDAPGVQDANSTRGAVVKQLSEKGSHRIREQAGGQPEGGARDAWGAIPTTIAHGWALQWSSGAVGLCHTPKSACPDRMEDEEGEEDEEDEEDEGEEEDEEEEHMLEEQDDEQEHQSP